MRVDESWHRSFAVAAWPRSGVGAGWLSPLLLAAPPAAVRTVAVHLEPVPPLAAARIARAGRTRAELDRADRGRLGLSGSAAADRAVGDSVGMDEELAAGHAAHRLIAVLTCTAGDRAALEAASRAIREAAALAHCELRPLHGQHDVGLAATLPLCRARPGGAL